MAARRGQQCSICKHRERAAVDLALARGVSVTALSRRYRISTDAIYRHARNHLPAQLTAGPSIEGLDLDKLRETESQSLLANLVALRHRLFAALDMAEEYGDAGQVPRIAGALHENLGLCAKIGGQSGPEFQHDDQQRADNAGLPRNAGRIGEGIGALP